MCAKALAINTTAAENRARRLFPPASRSSPGCGCNSRHGTIENDVIPDNRIGYHLDAFSGVEDNVALDNINPFTTAIYEYARIFSTYIGIVNDIISDNVPVRAELYFNAVVAAAARTAQVVNIIPLE